MPRRFACLFVVFIVVFPPDAVFGMPRQRVILRDDFPNRPAVCLCRPGVQQCLCVGQTSGGDAEAALGLPCARFGRCVMFVIVRRSVAAAQADEADAAGPIFGVGVGAQRLFGQCVRIGFRRALYESGVGLAGRLPPTFQCVEYQDFAALAVGAPAGGCAVCQSCRAVAAVEAFQWAASSNSGAQAMAARLACSDNAQSMRYLAASPSM